MSLIQALVLGILQGATEFIPVSSSGHLVLVPWLLGWPAAGLLYDTMVHWGTLVAVAGYFRRDILVIVTSVLRDLIARAPLRSAESRLGWLIVVATIPATVLGFLFEAQFEALFGRPRWVALFLIATGLILLASEWIGRRERDEHALGARDALLIGLAQALAIAPGISRSGATMGAGLALGLERPAAARFSFLMMLPIVFGAGLLQLVDLVGAETAQVGLVPLGVGFIAAAVTGYLCIAFLLDFLRRGTLRLFGLYCCTFGTIALIIALTGLRS